MTATLNGKLLDLATAYYISYGSSEQIKIDRSVETLKSRIKSHFGSNVLGVIEFGSYKRDTLLPRKYDEHSDIDLMIVFNHATLKLTPGTYRSQLVSFAEKFYSRSEVYKTSPTVTLELDHIKYDLVPSYEDTDFWGTKRIYIPENDSNWMITDPNGFSSELTRVNILNEYNIKKVIRLLKAWNAKVGYPLESFTLEQRVVAMSFNISNKTLENYFFTAIDNLSSYTNGNYFSPNLKIDALKSNAKRVKEYLEQNNKESAIMWLGHILPI